MASAERSGTKRARSDETYETYETCDTPGCLPVDSQDTVAQVGHSPSQGTSSSEEATTIPPCR